jgi:hypothetical protein
MKHKKETIVTKKTIWTCAATLAVAGALVAGAGTPADATPLTHDPNGELSKTTMSIGLWNNSSDNLVLQSATGDNEGVPSNGSALLAGENRQNFEVVFRAAKTTTVTATYAVQDDTGATIGTAVVKLSDNAVGARAVSSSYTASDGGSLPLKTDYFNNGDWEVEDANPIANTTDASTTAGASVVSQYCGTSANSAVCTFRPTSRVSTTQSKLVASDYNLPSSQSPQLLTAEDGYDDQSSVNTGTSMNATVKLFNVLSLGVSQAYSETVSFDKLYTVTDSISVPPGNTGYIWADIPVVQYGGTMTVKLGNSTWTVNDVVLTAPDPSQVATYLRQSAFPGEWPIGTPDTPPTTAAEGMLRPGTPSHA